MMLAPPLVLSIMPMRDLSSAMLESFPWDNTTVMGYSLIGAAVLVLVYYALCGVTLLLVLRDS